MHRTVLALALAGAVALPAAASAAPAAMLTLADGGTSAFSWTGGPGNGLLSKVDGLGGLGKIKCGDPTADCADTLIKVNDAGDLTFDLHGDSGSSATDQSADPTAAGDEVRYDLDAVLYASDAEGTIGDEVGESSGEGYDEQVVGSDLEPGYYVARVIFYESVQGTFHASAKVTPYVPPLPDDEEE